MNLIVVTVSWKSFGNWETQKLESRKVKRFNIRRYLEIEVH